MLLGASVSVILRSGEYTMPAPSLVREMSQLVLLSIHSGWEHRLRDRSHSLLLGRSLLAMLHGHWMYLWLSVCLISCSASVNVSNELFPLLVGPRVDVFRQLILLEIHVVIGEDRHIGFLVPLDHIPAAGNLILTLDIRVNIFQIGSGSYGCLRWLHQLPCLVKSIISGSSMSMSSVSPCQQGLIIHASKT